MEVRVIPCGMSAGGLYERCASLDRGWQACLLATAIVVGELVLTMV